MATIKDLAKMSEVSVTTVSRVLNNHPYVSADKREAVLRAIKATDYHQNINAVNLIKGKTKTVGVVVPFLDHPHFSNILDGVTKEAVIHGFKLLLFLTDYQKDREREALNMLKEKQMDALIIVSKACELSEIKAHQKYGKIIIGEEVDDKEISSAYVDQNGAFVEALEFLYDHGHRLIGYSVSRNTSENSLRRKQHYIEFLKERGLPFREEYIIDKTMYIEDSQRIFNKLNSMQKKPTGMVITSDQVAAGVMINSSKNNIRIPEDLAIVGSGNDPIAKLMELTTVEVPLIEIGKSLFKQALQEEISQIQFKANLIVRKTV
ncbi:LacI family DNA-binding transcriptional regulator [Lacticigenium naphthae]|uniref:LacI family DNA-binding transcriptional regulator n=1 Tax=Lacticigenium naphthae TaxID=515351 RepID=UPI00040EC178|nr:LacI family DNA-binding transcriptional regulator [Lacticigenium naphthae]